MRPASPTARRCRRGFAAVACLSSLGRTDFRVASTARPPGFDLLGRPRRRNEEAIPVRSRSQRPRCRTYEPARRVTLSGPPTSLVVAEDHGPKGVPLCPPGTDGLTGPPRRLDALKSCSLAAAAAASRGNWLTRHGRQPRPGRRVTGRTGTPGWAPSWIAPSPVDRVPGLGLGRHGTRPPPCAGPAEASNRSPTVAPDTQCGNCGVWHFLAWTWFAVVEPDVAGRAGA
jgi:hypothetical protein